MEAWAGSQRRHILGGLIVALVFISAWSALHPARPGLSTDDLYTHLSVARHLTRGEGFQTDITFPLSFAFPFAQALPQPLVHRQPGYALMLTVPCALAGNDPDKTLTLVRGLQIGLLGLLVWVGVVGLLRMGQALNVLPWLMILLVNPLLAFAVDWGYVELTCAVLLLIIWTRVKLGQTQAPTWIDGLLIGLLTLLRLDLFWLPWLWWGLYFGARRFSANSGGAPWWRRWALAVLVWVLLLLPWEARNIQLTGQPFFSVQSQAEHVKDTTIWPGYSVYQQLQPQPLLESVQTSPIPMARKSVRGVRFYVTNLHRYLPQIYLWAALMALVFYGLTRIRPLNRKLRPNHRQPLSVDPKRSPLGPYVVLALSLSLLIAQYAIFDHSLRHLLVVLPLVALEGAALTGTLAWPVIGPRLAPRFRTPIVALLASAVLTWLVLLVMPTQLPGWTAAEQQARQHLSSRVQRVEKFRHQGPDNPFTHTADVTWFADKPGIWTPIDPQVRQQILNSLSEQP